MIKTEVEIKNYNDAKEFLENGKNKQERSIRNKKSTNIIDVGDGILGLKYHSTIVIEYYPDGNYKLNSGGWRTKTTKDRINEFTPFNVIQRNNVWYVNGVPFKDNITINKDGSIENHLTEKDLKKVEKKRNKIKKYVNKFAESMPVPIPNNGDCWYCLGMLESNDHLWQHIEEEYFVPSLLLNALKDNGYKYDQIGTMGVFEDTGDLQFINIDLAKNALRKYLYNKLLYEEEG